MNCCRSSTVCIVQLMGNTKTIHFCESPLNTSERMYPIWKGETVFQAVDRIMVAEGAAHNVSSVESVRRCGDSTDYEIVYNRSLRKERETNDQIHETCTGLWL